MILLKQKNYMKNYNKIVLILSIFILKSNLTLVFSECVLTYIDANKVDNIIKYFNEKFENVIFVTYEMFNPYDGFGKMMVRNFEVKF